LLQIVRKGFTSIGHKLLATEMAPSDVFQKTERSMPTLNRWISAVDRRARDQAMVPHPGHWQARERLVTMNEVTSILSAIEQGDAQATEQLLPLVYDELRKLAAQRLAQEKPGQTLQATALVHEAFLRLVEQDKAQRWDSRGHFFAAAAEAMRRILVDNARRKGGAKRGRGRARVELNLDALTNPERADDLIALDEALEQLAQTDPRTAELVKLRFFAGVGVKQAAKLLGISPRTADLRWAYARAWLFERLAGGAP
jgi:RNA polymerase sigma factor (TIGR02999 family)